jgi:hypothetical protein
VSENLLDLVRRYGDEQANIVGAMEMAGAGQVQEHEQAAEALFDRIAALIPQQPVQARDYYGVPLWHHGCGEVKRFPRRPERRCDCFNPNGSWRPLLVGGDPAPELQRLLAEVKRLESDNERLKRIHAADENAVLQVIDERDDAQDWADRLSQAIAKHLRIDIGEHSNANLPWQAALIALTDATLEREAGIS